MPNGFMLHKQVRELLHSCADGLFKLPVNGAVFRQLEINHDLRSGLGSTWFRKINAFLKTNSAQITIENPALIFAGLDNNCPRLAVNCCADGRMKMEADGAFIFFQMGWRVTTLNKEAISAK